MTRILNRIDAFYDLTIRGLVLITSFVLVTSLTLLVICRYFLGIPMPGAHELSLFAAVWLYMAGVVMASRNRQHLVVDMLESQLEKPLWKHLHGLVVAALTLIIAGFFAWWVWKMLAWGIKRPQNIQALGLPLWAAQAALALAAVTAILYALRDMTRAVSGLLCDKEGR